MPDTTIDKDKPEKPNRKATAQRIKEQPDDAPETPFEAAYCRAWQATYDAHHKREHKPSKDKAA